MSSIKAGAAIAVVIAGWPLYSLVTSGGLDATSALLRGGVVAAGCAFGVTMVVRLAQSYEQAITRAAAKVRTEKLDHLYSDMAGAVANGTLVDEDGNPTGGTPPGTNPAGAKPAGANPAGTGPPGGGPADGKPSGSH